jgi:hypothetical protein
MSMEISGCIIQIGDVYNNNDGTFTKQEIVIEFAVGDYFNVAVLEAIQGDVEKLSAFNIGDRVKAEFYLNGRNKPWTDKNGKERYFNVLKIKSIELVGDQPAPQPQYQQPQQGQAVNQSAPVQAAPIQAGDVPQSDNVPF